MKARITYLALLFAGMLTFSACSLDEDNPSGGDAVITNYDTWYGLEAYCYSALAEQLYSVYDYLSLAEGGNDMWITTGTNPTYAKEPMYYDGLTTSTNASNKVFKQAYACIASCNAVIDYASQVEGGSASNIAILTAEAKVLRAFYNLTLVTHYGPVTLSTDLPDAANTTPQRNTIEEFYTSITTDLQEAAEVLDVDPFEDNYARVCKKTALGLLARAYAQGAGEGLYEDGVSYWQRAKEVAVDLINNASSYGLYLYDDVSDLWAQDNNRANPEALFIVSGRDASSEAYNYVSCNNNMFRYTMCNPYKCSDIHTQNIKSNYYTGRADNNTFAPTPYTIGVFDPTWDKRWENTFMTAFGTGSLISTGWYGTRIAYGGYTVITESMVETYGMGEEFVGDTIFPYADVGYEYLYSNQYPVAGVWPKGLGGDATTDQLLEVKNPYVIDYPVDVDDNRFSIVLWPGTLQGGEDKTDAEKAESMYFTVNMSTLFDDDLRYKTEVFDGTNSYALYPSFIKYKWCYSGVFGSNALQYNNGDVMVMRTAEVYLIAAEACQQLGDATTAATYLNVLRNRAGRDGATVPQLTSVTEDDIFDEYARELAGEFNRWALLKRHAAFESRLAEYNPVAYSYFDSDIHYCRPVSSDFLEQIDNADEYGDNGYGTTASKGY